MSVWALGINHHTAPLDLRGRFAFALDQIQPTLNGYRASLPRQPEATLLSTCNRTELYAAGDQAAVEPTLEWLAKTGGVGIHVLKDHSYVLREDQAARHAFRVASCTSCSSVRSRWLNRCAAPPKSALTPSA